MSGHLFFDFVTYNFVVIIWVLCLATNLIFLSNQLILPAKSFHHKVVSCCYWSANLII